MSKGTRGIIRLALITVSSSPDCLAQLADQVYMLASLPLYCCLGMGIIIVVKDKTQLLLLTAVATNSAQEIPPTGTMQILLIYLFRHVGKHM